jgi:hypothetical protein
MGFRDRLAESYTRSQAPDTIHLPSLNSLRMSFVLTHARARARIHTQALWASFRRFISCVISTAASSVTNRDGGRCAVS